MAPSHPPGNSRYARSLRLAIRAPRSEIHFTMTQTAHQCHKSIVLALYQRLPIR
jgi:hypothetical protein